MVIAITAMPSPSPNDIHVFDRETMTLRRKRAAANFADYDFLFRWAEERIFESLPVIKRDFKNVLVIGGRYSADFFTRLQSHLSADAAIQIYDRDESFYPNPPHTLVTGDEEVLPFAQESFDLILSNLNFHNVNDLPGLLIQIRKSLKPDGLLIGSLFGGETLFELRESLTQGELQTKGGASPRVHPFATKQDMGALLQRAGYNLPVIDSDIVTVTYENMFKLMADLRGMGETNIIAARDKAFVGKRLFFEAAAYYAAKFAEKDSSRIEASFEVIFIHGWAPHESQQKPLKPGSAQNRMADALGTDEGKL